MTTLPAVAAERHDTALSQPRHRRRAMNLVGTTRRQLARQVDELVQSNNRLRRSVSAIAAGYGRLIVELDEAKQTIINRDALARHWKKRFNEVQQDVPAAQDFTPAGNDPAEMD